MEIPTWVLVVLCIVCFDIGFIFGAWWVVRDRELDRQDGYDDKNMICTEYEKETEAKP
jgi:hypothetical protein